MQPHRGRPKDGFWMLGALVPAIVMTIVAIVALTPGQVRAEEEAELEEPDVIICDGLGSLAMYVNTMTLHNLGELTKSTSSWDGECEMSMTLIDVSDEDHPADKAKSCTVTASPVRDDYGFDIATTESGHCDTVEFSIEMSYGDLPATWTPYVEPVGDEEESGVAGSTGSGVHGQASCNFGTHGDHPHISSTGVYVSVHGWWTDDGGDCPHLADVTVWLKAYACHWWGCRWYTVAKNKERVRARNIYRDWVNARDYCGPSTSPTGYRGVVDVDLVCQWDSWYKYTTPHKNLWCNPT